MKTEEQSVNERDARKKIEELRVTQNREMLRVLEEEQKNESDRDETVLKVTDPVEKTKLSQDLTARPSYPFNFSISLSSFLFLAVRLATSSKSCWLNLIGDLSVSRDSPIDWFLY